jgi:hypothetical protein
MVWACVVKAQIYRTIACKNIFRFIEIEIKDKNSAR